MRALAFIVFSLLGARVASAEAPAFSVSSSYFSASGQALVTTAQQASNLSSQSYDVSASSGLVQNTYRLRLKSSQIKRDVRNYFFIDRFGETVSLADTFDGQETALGGGVDLVLKRWTFSVDGAATATESPIGATVVVGKIAYANYDYGTNVSLELQNQELKRPESFFREAETNLLGSVPPRLVRQEARLTWDQLMNEEMRFVLTSVAALRKEEGRESVGGSARFFWGISDVLTLLAGTEHRRDLKGNLPKDNRGYFDLTSYEVGVGHELSRNLLVKLIVGTTIEHETARGTLPRQTVGTDGYAAGLDFRRGRLTALLSSKVEQSNTGYKSYQIAGGLSWEI